MTIQVFASGAISWAAIPSGSAFAGVLVENGVVVTSTLQDSYSGINQYTISRVDVSNYNYTYDANEVVLNGTPMFTFTWPQGGSASGPAGSGFSEFLSGLTIGDPFVVTIRLDGLSWTFLPGKGTNRTVAVTGTGCTVSGNGSYGAGSSITITATPDVGKTIISANINGGDHLAEILAGGYTFTMPDANVTGAIVATSGKYEITASWTDLGTNGCKYSPYFNTGGGNVLIAPRIAILGNGQIIENGGTVEVDAGDSVMISATTNYPYRISSMVVSEVGELAGPGTAYQSRIANFTPSGDVTVAVEVAADLFCAQAQPGTDPINPVIITPIPIPVDPVDPPWNPDPEIPDPEIHDPERFGGCTDPRALNYDPTASYNDGSCVLPPGELPPITLCLDFNALNFLEEGICKYRKLEEEDPIDFIIVDQGTQVELTKVDEVYQAAYNQLVQFIPIDAYAPFWWSFGDMQMSVSESPEHRYYFKESATFYPSLLANNNLEQLRYVRKAIAITYSRPWGWRPVDHATGITLRQDSGVYQAVSGQRIRFVPWGLEPGEARTWDFDDLVTSTLDEPQHVYIVTTDTTYDVDLTLVADSTTVTHSIHVSVDDGSRIPPNPSWPDSDVIGTSKGMMLRWRDEMGNWSKERFISLKGRDPQVLLNRLGQYRVRQWEIVMTHASPQVVVYMEEEVELNGD